MGEVADRARTYDIVDHAFTVGRRRRRLRRMVTGGTVFTAVLATVVAVNLTAGRPNPDEVHITQGPAQTTAPPPTLPASCEVEPLPLPPGAVDMSVVTGADPSGRFIVGKAYPGGSARRLLIWDNLSVSTVDMSGADAQLYDVNSSGIAVGYSFMGEDMAAWVYEDGRTSRLGGGFAQALGINDDGVIVGNLRPHPVEATPTVWRSPTAAAEVLPIPQGISFATADAVDEDGTIVGTIDFGRAGLRVWRSDGRVLTLSPGEVVVHGLPGTELSAIAIRAGVVLLFAAADIGSSRYLSRVLWDTRTGKVRELSGVYDARALNARGWVAAATVRGLESQVTVLNPDDGSSVVLPPLVESGGAEAVSISDDGTVLAGSSASSLGTTTAVVWHCR